MINVIRELTRIVQAVAQSDSAAEQVDLVVNSISDVMAVDVCSLYLLNGAGDAVLASTKGLSKTAVGKVRLPAKQGLVGRVAATRHSINLADADQHPDYVYVPETGEERFRSFCGVPLVNAGEVLGVLVVQQGVGRQFSEDEEAFLVTLAAQLAMVVHRLPKREDEAKADAAAMTQRLTGVKGASGVAIGVLRLCGEEDVAHAADAQCEDVDAELAQWYELLERARDEVERERKAVEARLTEGVSAIFGAYTLLLSDAMLVDQVAEHIRAGCALPTALRKTISQIEEVFRAMDDPYLKARCEDIHQLGNKLYGLWRNEGGIKESHDDTQPVVLMGRQVGISDIARVKSGMLAGIVCYDGSSLSHSAVLANAMDIPAVMGVKAPKRVSGGETVIVDGNHGVAIVNPTDMLVSEFQKVADEGKELSAQLQLLREADSTTPDGVNMRLYTNTGLLADIAPGLNYGAQGVGLYRTEIPFMVHESFPSEEEQIEVYRQVLRSYRGKPVYMRVLDIGGDKQLPYFPMSEENPALGWRGIRFCLDNSPLLMTQVRAMLRASEGVNNLNILLPMVISGSELDQFHEILQDALSQLDDEGYKIQTPPVGVMVEVPATISQLPFWRDRIDFVSIGSNDLSQYLLALDRNNARVSSRYDHIHPAVLHEIQRVVNTARILHLPISLCGEMASDPVAVALLMGMGVTTVSMSAPKLLRIKWLVRTLPVFHAEKITAMALSMDSAQEIREMVRRELCQLGLEALFSA